MHRSVFGLGLIMGLAFVLGAASSAGATPIGPSCGSCQGSLYDLTYSGSPISTTATTETFRISYTIDAAGYTGAGTFLDTVALKVSSSLVNATLTSAPGGVANWVEMLGGLNSAGCSGAGGGYDCVRVAALVNAPIVPGGTYEWVFDIEVATGTLFTGPGESSVKARYVNSAGGKVGALVSEGVTLSVPEPGAISLASMAFLALRRRGMR